MADGLKKRPPRILKALLSDAYDSASFIHVVDRSATERYKVFIDGGDLKVYDLDTGDEKTVAFPDGKGYLTAINPKTTFRAKTVADYTFITNKSVTIDMDAGSMEPVRGPTKPSSTSAPATSADATKSTSTEALCAAFFTADGIGDDGGTELETIDTTNIARALIGGIGPAKGEVGYNPEGDLGKLLPVRWRPPLRKRPEPQSCPPEWLHVHPLR